MPSTKNKFIIPDILWVKTKKTQTKHTPFSSTVSKGIHSGFDYSWQNEKTTPKSKQEKYSVFKKSTVILQGIFCSANTWTKVLFLFGG